MTVHVANLFVHIAKKSKQVASGSQDAQTIAAVNFRPGFERLREILLIKVKIFQTVGNFHRINNKESPFFIA